MFCSVIKRGNFISIDGVCIELFNMFLKFLVEGCFFFICIEIGWFEDVF